MQTICVIVAAAVVVVVAVDVVLVLMTILGLIHSPNIMLYIIPLISSYLSKELASNTVAGSGCIYYTFISVRRQNSWLPCSLLV